MANDPDNFIDAHVSTHQCKLAINALCGHELKREQKQQENELLPRKEQYIWLVVAVKQMHPEKKLTPIRIPIVHPLVDPRTSPICLITKDPQREYKVLLESKKIKFISRVVGLEKLKGKFKPFEARRLLLKENGMFLADERVIPLLPKLLGKRWFEAKKQPIPVCLTRKDLKSELERAISSTYMHQNRGTCTSIKISTLSQSPAHILANLTCALPAIVSNIKGGWSNIQSLHIKTNSSVSLPVWNCSLGDNEGGRWAGAKANNEAAVSDEEEESSTTEPPKKTSKRHLDDDSEKPKKKIKSAESTGGLNVTAHSPVPAVLSGVNETGKKFKEGKRAESTNMTSDSPLPTVLGKSRSKKVERTEPINVADDSPVPVLSEKKAGKKFQKAKTPATGAAASERLTIKSASADVAVPVRKEELKQKRSASKGEKKKDKVVKVKSGKSAKDKVIGKQVARG